MADRGGGGRHLRATATRSGVPTVGGELTFDHCYAQNPLVNVLCMGVLPIDRLVLGQASGVGQPGRAARARRPGATGSAGSASWPRPASAGRRRRGRRRPSGPASRSAIPYEEKRLIEACLELLDAKLVVGIQDLGGAGLVCATSETAARGGVGMDVDVSAVPRREPGMAPCEVMTSREPGADAGHRHPRGSWPGSQEVCRRWEVRSAVVGRVTEPPAGRAGRLRILDGFDGQVLGDVPAGRPQRRRPALPPADGPARRPRGPRRRRPRRPPPPADCGADVLRPAVLDPSWVYRQYDHQLFLNTVDGPGGDAAVAPPGRPRACPRRSGAGPHHRLQPDLVLDRPRGRARRHRGRGRAQRGLRRGARPWPWSTASTSATPSTPRSCGSCRRPSTG